MLPHLLSWTETLPTWPHWGRRRRTELLSLLGWATWVFTQGWPDRQHKVALTGQLVLHSSPAHKSGSWQYKTKNDLILLIHSRKVLPFWQYCRNKHFDQNWYFCQIDIFVKLIFSSKLIFLSKLIFSSKLTILSKSYFWQFHQLFLMTSSTIDSYINFWYFHQLFDQNIKCLFR